LRWKIHRGFYGTDLKAYGIYQDGKAIVVLMALAPWLPLFLTQSFGVESDLFRTIWIIVASVLSGTFITWAMVAACV